MTYKYIDRALTRKMELLKEEFFFMICDFVLGVRCEAYILAHSRNYVILL